MALGNVLINGLSSAASKAYDAYKSKAKATAQMTTPTKAVATTKTATPTVAPKTVTPTYNNKSVYDSIYSSTNGDVGSALTNAINTNASVDTVKKIYQDRLSKATGTQFENDSIMKNALSYINSQQPVIANPYEDSIAKLGEIPSYGDLNSQIEDYYKAAVNQGVNRLNSQKATINQSADDNARQAYIASMQSKKVLPQQLASQGINGGATESAMLGLSTNYENNLNNINTNRQNSLLDIDNAVLDLKNSGDLNTVEQTLANNQAALSAYQSMLNNSASYNQWLSEYNANRSDTKYNQNYQEGRDQVTDTNYNNELASANKQTEYNNILNRLGMGLISANDAVALGVPAKDVQSYVERIKAAQNAEIANTVASTNKINTSNSKNNETSTSNPVLTTVDKYLAQGNREKAITALASIYTNEQIKQYLASKGYRTDDIDWGTFKRNKR